MGVAEAQRRIGSREYAEWMAFFRLEAEEEERARRQAHLAAKAEGNMAARLSDKDRRRLAQKDEERRQKYGTR